MQRSGYRDFGAADLAALLAELRRGRSTAGCLYLLGATSHLAAGQRASVDRIEAAAERDADGAGLCAAVGAAAATVGVPVAWEHPGDVIPLPAGYRERARDAGPGWRAGAGALQVLHFDPYSVVLRLIARGDEPDYQVSLDYVRHGWVEIERLEGLLADVLPHFTSETIQQDPAEFRRKFRGFLQMWRAQAASKTV